MHAEGNYYDREEVKRMIPAEKEMFEQMTASIEQCQGILLHNIPHTLHASRHGATQEEAEPEPEPCAEMEEEGVSAPLQSLVSPISHPCVLVHVLEDMDSFMGVDGRVYALSKGDIVTLPERNAAVLSERNIVLNINLCK
jgi:DNA replication factor GINS